MKELLGLDTIEFGIALADLPSRFQLHMREHRSPLSCKSNYIELRRTDKKIIVAVNLPRFLRMDNAKPFSLADTRCCGEMVQDILMFLAECDISDDVLISTAEVNITLDIAEFSRVSDVLRLFLYAFDGESYGKAFACFNAVKLPRMAIHTKRLESLKTGRSTDGSHLLKVYDKGAEMGIIDGRELLRLEMVVQGRMLKKLFADRTVGGVICEKGIASLVSFFCTTWTEYTYPRIKKYRKAVCRELERKLCQTAERYKRGFAVEAVAWVSNFYFVDADVLKWGVVRFCKQTERRNSQSAIFNNLVDRFDYVPSGITAVLHKIDAVCSRYTGET